ncbi:hypothetical protein [Mangrovitalea sediminis]|uniref:hypothetical protein n=1 Tax=Mangrovitalea sediminis TaxID=1982043 RepID=UPI000BE54AAC|nr:hypothetical protein [Mangrovitalea sediminis]
MSDAGSDDRQAPGTAPAAKTVKAGCGIRYDPETLNEEVGFDFSDAASLLAADTAPTENQSISLEKKDASP